MTTSVQQNPLADLFPAQGDIPSAYALPEPVVQETILIGGELRPWTGPMRTVISPVYLRRGEALEPCEIGRFPEATVAESLAALNAAVAAYDKGRGTWPTMSIAERIACMQDFTRKMIEKRDEVVRLIMWEIGKNLPDAEKEFDRTVDYIRATINAVRDLDNDNSRFVMVEGTIGQIRRTPLGVVLCMGPFNYPLNETFATLIPALIMGNTVVFKTPRWGVLLFTPLIEAFRTSFPKGVINFVYGQGHKVIPPLLNTGEINVLTLIGSSKVADELKKQHPKVNRLRAVLGLDAKNAAIVLPDADLDLAVRECLSGALSFNGQRCTALKMLLVHSSIVDEFLQRFVTALGKLGRGMPWDKGAALTPLPDIGKAQHMHDLVEDALALGARIVNAGGGASCATFFEPAVVYPVKEGMRLYREEQFGPVVPVTPFDTIETALDYVISSEYGQQVSLFSANPDVIAELVDPLVNQVCRVNLNCQCQRGPDVFPFTGRKDSAEGTLSVTDALRSFSIRSMIAAKQTDDSKKLLDDIVLNHKSKFINTRFVF